MQAKLMNAKLSLLELEKETAKNAEGVNPEDPVESKETDDKK